MASAGPITITFHNVTDKARYACVANDVCKACPPKSDTSWIFIGTTVVHVNDKAKFDKPLKSYTVDKDQTIVIDY